MTKKTETDDTAPPPKKGKGKLILGGMGALALTGGGVAAGFYVSSDTVPQEDANRPKLVERSDEAPPVAAEGEAKDAPLKVGTVAVKDDRAKVDSKKFEITYVPIEQNFTANLADGAGFVQAGLSLATYYDGKVIANIQRQTVPIRSAVLMVLSEQDAAVLSTAQGKQLLQRHLTQAINQVLRDKEGFGGVENVYFTNLVIQ